MAYVIMDHRVSWCFGISLAPRTGSLKGHDLWPVFFELAPLRDAKASRRHERSLVWSAL